MSFIYDDLKLLKSLIVAGEKSIQKRGQQTDPQQLATLVLAKKMAQQLMRQVDPNSVPKATAPIGSELGEGATPELDRKNLESLGDFLKWASDNAITWDGKRVAYVYNDPNQQGPVGYWKFLTYKIDRERDPYDRTAIQVPAYADKDALIKLITYLRDSQEAKTEKVFAVMLGRLINQTNQFLEKTEQIGPRTEQKPAEAFNANDVVDGFKDTTINIKDPYAGIQEFMKATDPNMILNRMTWRDVSSKAGLIDWLRGMKFIGEDGKPYDPTAPGVDPCGAIHVLYLRAKYLSQYATDRLRPGFSKLEQAYLKQIQTLGPQFDFNDQACAVTKPGTITPQQPGQPGQQGQSGQPGKISPQALQQLAALRPFHTNNIDFREIKLFLDRYNQLANKPGIDAMIGQIKHSMDMANRLMGTADAPIQIDNLTGDQVKDWSNQPIPLLNILNTIISYSGRVYQDFFNEFNTILGEDVARPVEQQLTVQQTNLGTILRVRDNLIREIPTSTTPRGKR
jgi:hypothetical protein